MGQPDTINYFSEPEIIRVIPSWLHKVKGFTAQKNFKILKPDQEEKLKILEQFGTMADKAISGLLIFVQTREPP